MLHGEKGIINLCNWKSTKHKRAVRSSYASELLAATNMIDEMEFIRTLMLEVQDPLFNAADWEDEVLYARPLRTQAVHYLILQIHVLKSFFLNFKMYRHKPMVILVLHPNYTISNLYVNHIYPQPLSWCFFTGSCCRYCQKNIHVQKYICQSIGLWEQAQASC